MKIGAVMAFNFERYDFKAFCGGLGALFWMDGVLGLGDLLFFAGRWREGSGNGKG
ncbi:hypothetical protein [Acidicapsa ligni]|uniref:hypothetical protein n=1 Tax=Acidicapsa ligni TaxID=542300 RepID=UPI0021DFCC3A|nr:hypothetical protein [Acidicapsa ligni]